MVTDERRKALLASNFVNVTTAAELLGVTRAAINNRVARDTIKWQTIDPDDPKSLRVIPLSEIERLRAWRTGGTATVRTKEEAEQMLDVRMEDLLRALDSSHTDTAE